MINNSLIKVQVQEFNSPTKPQRRLINQRIKPYIQAYGLSPDLFEMKGKSVVYKNNNPNNQSQQNRSVMSIRSSTKKPYQKISIHRPQTASLQLPNNFDLPITNKYANLFNEIKNAENKPQFQYLQKAEKSLIFEEVDERSEQSIIRKYDSMLKNIAHLEKVKQQKIQELEMLQSKIDEVKNVDIHSSRFIIKKNVHKSSLREKKDKAASLIQAHVKGRFYQRRYIFWKKKNEEKLRKVIFIQQWWKNQLKHIKIQKQFRITHRCKQVRLIGGRTIFIITNYSYILYRIRLLLIDRMGVMKGVFRLYLNLQNCSTVLNEDISKESFEFESLMNLIISNLIQLIQIKDDHFILDLQNQNIIDIPHLMLQVYMKLNFIATNQYQLLIHIKEEAQQESQNQIEQLQQNHYQYLQTENYQENKKKDNQNDQDIQAYSNLVEQQVNIYTAEQYCQKIEESQSSEVQQNINQQQSYDENTNKEIQREIIENQDQNSKILNNQNMVEIQDKQVIEQQIQDNKTFQNENRQTDKEFKDKLIQFDDLKNNQSRDTKTNQDQEDNIQQNQTTDQIQQIYIQNPQNLPIKQNSEIKSKIILDIIQESQQFQQSSENLSDENNQEIQQTSNQINYNSIQSSNKVKLFESTQINQNEVSSSQRLVYKQPDQEEIQTNQVDIIQMNLNDIDVDQTECVKSQNQGLKSVKQDLQTSPIEQNSQMNLSQERIVENKKEEFEFMEIKVNKPIEIQQANDEDDQQEQIFQSEYIYYQNSNIFSQKNEADPQSQIYKKKDNQNQQQQPSQIDFHLLKSCESNIFEPVKYLNSGELLSRTNFLVQLGQLEKIENENTSLLISGDLKKEVEDLPEPVNLRKNNSNQQEQFMESQSFLRRMPSDFKSPLMDDTLKLSATFKFQISSEFKAFESGQLISQLFDIKIQQQDSLEYSLDESQDLQPIYITTIRVDDINVDVFQIKDLLRLKDKNDIYRQFDFKISKIQQSNCDYIIQNLFVYIIKNGINCIEGNQIVRIQRYLRRFRFIKSCVLTLYRESILICLFKSFFGMKLSIYGQVQQGVEIMIERMGIKSRKILENNFYSICPLVLSSEMEVEQMILTAIKAFDFESE
ncbi:unnamed protein product (macronuclear) [Paramecium tetraurelia]|uniref:IQ calmodulin-binding motif family protein n=1 Tax=Paramecium tetraurelia TaxID=5888 RepID=A0DMA9_PARTE|nr:uncharacterized protein GSPATT00018394001 [Paramecium tetraurelia]CAK84176.1 unnamed protein product [Paramecium tetraurelia]|eukprot:XP_001451573.1 hypothetical protein (macronuclear) [Paramecium tetraurelia strain d4-2]